MIEGRIIRIFDERTVALNVGADHGVTSGMEFGIYTPYEQVVDPQTGVVLGQTRRRKAVVVADSIHKAFTIATAKRRIVRTSSAAIGTLAAFSGQIEERQDPLPVERDELEPYETGTTVHIGDQVEGVERTTTSRPPTSSKPPTTTRLPPTSPKPPSGEPAT